MSRLTVNGRPVAFRMDPQTPLLWALRDAANLTGTKYGCGIGDCGACMVMVDGEALRSCLISLAEAEGLGTWEERHVPPPSPSAPRRSGGQKKRELNMEDARAVARSLRNRRDWEKE